MTTLQPAALRNIVLLSFTAFLLFNCQKNDPIVSDLERRVELLELKIREKEQERNSPSEPPQERGTMSTESEASEIPGEEISEKPSPEPLEIMEQGPETADPQNSAVEPEVEDGEESQQSQPAEETPEPLSAKNIPFIEVNAAYKRALDNYHARRHEEAASVFKAIFQEHPTHPLAPNALYWHGETEYDQDHFNNAILLFQQVATHYPESTKAPAALLKKGKSQEKLGQFEAALETYQLVMKHYPQSDAAAMAREWQ